MESRLNTSVCPRCGGELRSFTTGAFGAKVYHIVCAAWPHQHRWKHGAGWEFVWRKIDDESEQKEEAAASDHSGCSSD